MLEPSKDQIIYYVLICSFLDSKESVLFFSFTRLYAQCTVIFSYGFKMFQSTLNKCISRHISVAFLGSNEVIRVCNDRPVGPQKIKIESRNQAHLRP